MTETVQAFFNLQPAIVPAAAPQLAESHLGEEARLVRTDRNRGAAESNSEGTPRATSSSR
jgi:hypothetical protein